jgi:ABC-type ATPase with predicted acetyltransferase domain
MFENINFDVNEGDIIVLQARSGTGYVAPVRVSLVLIIIFITIAFSRPQKDYPIEVYSSSLSLSWDCRIQGKVSRVSILTTVSHVSVSGPPKLMVSLPSIQRDAKDPHANPMI